MIAPVEQRDGTKERKKEVEMIDLCLTPKAPYKSTIAAFGSVEFIAGQGR